jgi:hypothetical protein
MSDFIITERPNNIFYGDIFKIHNQGCLIFGSGKSQASSIASNSIEDAEVALDFACLTREEDTLYGHFESHIRARHIDDPVNERVKLKYFIRMLDKEETEQQFKDKKLEIILSDYDAFIQLSTFNITFSGQELLANLPGFPKVEFPPRKRFEKFIELTSGTDIKRFLIVPWTDKVEQKAKLIEEYISNDIK